MFCCKIVCAVRYHSVNRNVELGSAPAADVPGDDVGVVDLDLGVSHLFVCDGLVPALGVMVV